MLTLEANYFEVSEFYWELYREFLDCRRFMREWTDVFILRRISVAWNSSRVPMIDRR